MKAFILRILLCLSVSHFAESSIRAQNLYAGLSGGAVQYSGELQESQFSMYDIHFMGGVGMHYDWGYRFGLSAEFSAGHLSGRDRFRNRTRNLHFESRLIDFSIMGRFNLFNQSDIPLVPYVKSGLTLFHVNPFTIDATGSQVYLFPLRLEGQGLSQYPERKLQSRWNLAIPMSGGLELRMSENLRIDLEVTFRKTFTDYLDDVSHNYPDPDLLFASMGPKSVELSYRGDELFDGPPEFQTGGQRGQPTSDDWYNAVTVRFRYSLTRNRFYGGSRESYILRKKGWPYNW